MLLELVTLNSARKENQLPLLCFNVGIAGILDVLLLFLFPTFHRTMNETLETLDLKGRVG